MLIPKITSRIAQYMRFLENNSYHKVCDLEFEFFETAETFRAPPEQASWQKIAAPHPWGKAWTCSWFKATFVAPSALKGPLFLSVQPNADSLAFIDKKPYGAFNLFHKKLRVPADGREHTVHVEAYGGHPYPGCMPFEGSSIFLTIGKTIPDYPNTFEGGALLERNEAVYALYYDVRVLFEIAATLDNNSLRKARILKGLYDALMEIPFSAAASGAELERLAGDAAQKIAPLLALKNAPSTPQVHLVGGAHIDHAWLWTIAESERKAARTYSTMLRFMEEYPEFVFIQSQPCQLEIVKNEYPEVFAQVKAAYERGNWEPNGGMWVEADCNITGGESLIRQFLVGKQVTQELLGYSADMLWLPDVFGYAAALPQILAGCGIRYFVTSKINWNDTTRFPYDTFVWRGIDGSGVKTHYISSRMQGYNGKVSPASLAEIWNEVQHKEVQSAVVKPIGEGDGGGGTTREDLEMARRLVDLEGAPRSGWKKVSAALDEIFSGDIKDFPEWRGELYLELHRGTYTTQAKTKRYNRKLEFALRNTELFAALASLEHGTRYPYEDLLRHWKSLLTHQFHDIIPGSSIHRVYAEAEAAYQSMATSLASIGDASLAKLAGNGQGDGESNVVTLFNDLSWERSDPQVFLTEALGRPVDTANALKGADGAVYPLCPYTDLDGKEAVLGAPKLPALGWASFTLVKSTGDSPFTYKNGTLTTPFYTVCFDEAAHITSLFDGRRNRELVAGGGSFNRFISAEDVPVLWEAWDVDSDWTKYLTEEDRLVSTEIVADGPVCFRLRHVYKIGLGSMLTQDLVFYAKSPRIDFDTKVDWQETRRLLKVSFDTSIDTTEVRCEVQYGHLIRNTHRNLLQDRAKFEICAHKWISLEEAGHGIGLLNDCKYGHDVSGGCMRLTLLRAPTAPDETADKGEQRFLYALFPFEGAFAEAGLVRAGYELNAPLGIVAGGTGEAASFCSIDNAAVIVESVKAPEAAGNGGKRLVLRLYESLGGQAQTTLNFGARSLAAAWATDMLEGNPQSLAVNGVELALAFRPFEIKTLLLEFAS